MKQTTAKYQQMSILVGMLNKECDLSKVYLEHKIVNKIFLTKTEINLQSLPPK